MLNCLVFITFSFIIKLSNCEDYKEFQPSVVNPTREHTLYMWIYINSNANAKEVAKVVANLQTHVDYVSPPDQATEANKVDAGVGFGETFYKKVAKVPRTFPLAHRTGILGNLPSTGGDIFIHAKSNSLSKLYELADILQIRLPPGSIEHLNDIYGFVYRDSRDLSGFIDGTANPKLLEERKQVAIERNTGGSFALTQQWLHNMKFIKSQSDQTLEKFVGRTKNDSIKLNPLPPCSHVARMVNSTAAGAKPPFKIVRQSQPYGTVGGPSGLFFIAFANSTRNFDFQLDNMAGRNGRQGYNLPDDIMRISEAISGNYWYFPGKAELKELS